MYELGDIVSFKRNFYITLMYKGKYYCVNPCVIADTAELATNGYAFETLSELKEKTKNERDTRAMVVMAEEHGTEPAQVGDIYNRMMLFKKKKGRLVWVPLDDLKNNDLNDLLHRKNYYYQDGEEHGMLKHEIVEVAN